MAVLSAPCRIAEHEHQPAFFPWGEFFALGSLWAYEVPDAATLNSLSRHLRSYQSASLILVVIAIPLGAWLNIVWASLAASFLVPLLVYSMFIHRRTKSLVRVPVQCSLAIFAAAVGAEFLWRNVFLGVFCVVCSVWLSSADVGLITFPFAINSLVAIYGLCLIPN